MIGKDTCVYYKSLELSVHGKQPEIIVAEKFVIDASWLGYLKQV